MYTWYVVLAVLGTSTGLAVGGVAVERLQALEGWTALDAYRAMFWIYTGVGCVKALMALCMSQRCEQNNAVDKQSVNSGSAETEPLLAESQDTGSVNVPVEEERSVEPKKKRRFWYSISTISKPSRVVLVKLCSLFFLDSLGSGMAPFSLVNYYMDQKFNLPKGKLGGVMSATW